MAGTLAYVDAALSKTLNKAPPLKKWRAASRAQWRELQHLAAANEFMDVLDIALEFRDKPKSVKVRGLNTQASSK